MQDRSVYKFLKLDLHRFKDNSVIMFERRDFRYYGFNIEAERRNMDNCRKAVGTYFNIVDRISYMRLGLASTNLSVPGAATVGQAPVGILRAIFLYTCLIDYIG